MFFRIFILSNKNKRLKFYQTSKIEIESQIILYPANQLNNANPKRPYKIPN